MGWLFTVGATRAEIIKQVTAPESWPSGPDDSRLVEVRTLRHALVGNHLWALKERRETGAHFASTKYCLVLYLLGKTVCRGDVPSWGYKDIPAEMGPYACTCPATIWRAYIGMKPVPEGPYEEDFRNRHDRYQMLKRWRKRLSAGDAFYSTGSGTLFRYTGQKMGRCYVGRSKTGLFRVRPHSIMPAPVYEENAHVAAQ